MKKKYRIEIVGVYDGTIVDIALDEEAYQLIKHICSLSIQKARDEDNFHHLPFMTIEELTEDTRCNYG
jgi:hypothetical protein